MKVNLLEELAAEWYEYRGYFVWRNVPLEKNLELDSVAYHPETKHLVLIEPTEYKDLNYLEEKCRKTFEAGERHISDKFPSLAPQGTVPERISLLDGVSKEKTELAGGKVILVADFLKPIVEEVSNLSAKGRKVPGKFPLLRMLQYVESYQKQLFE